MPPKGKKNPQAQTSRRTGRPPQPGRAAAKAQGESRFRAIIPTFQIQAANGTTGLLYTDMAGISLTGANSMLLSPFSIGGRLYQESKLWLQYRVNECKFRFNTTLSTSGVDATLGSLTTTPSYTERLACFGTVADPDFAPVSYQNAVECGGKVVRLTENFSITTGTLSRRWCWTEAPITPSDADIRQCYFGRIYSFANNTSNASTAFYGKMEAEVDISFRFPADNDTAPAVQRNRELMREQFAMQQAAQLFERQTRAKFIAKPLSDKRAVLEKMLSDLSELTEEEIKFGPMPKTRWSEVAVEEDNDKSTDSTPTDVVKLASTSVPLVMTYTRRQAADVAAGKLAWVKVPGKPQ